MFRILGSAVLCWYGSMGLSLAAQEERKPIETSAKETRLDAGDLNKTTGAPVDLKSYTIGVEDILMIRVWREPDLTGPVVVRPDNMITLPLVGEVQAGGLTPQQLQSNLVEGLSKFINKPDVLVSVQSVRSKKYLISGEINRPGIFPLVTPTTVLEALVVAGGLREYANQKNIIIMRGEKRLKFNYKEVIKGKNLQQNILLENNDHILIR